MSVTIGEIFLGWLRVVIQWQASSSRLTATLMGHTTSSTLSIRGTTSAWYIKTAAWSNPTTQETAASHCDSQAEQIDLHLQRTVYCWEEMAVRLQQSSVWVMVNPEPQRCLNSSRINTRSISTEPTLDLRLRARVLLTHPVSILVYQQPKPPENTLNIRSCV